MVQQIINISHKWAEAVKTALVLIGFLAAIVTFLWAIGENETRDGLREFIGLDTFENSFERVMMEQTSLIEKGFEVASMDRAAIRHQQGKIRKQITDVETRVAQFEEIPPVAEFDQRRSRMTQPVCVQGELCGFQMRVRRTAFGRTCEAPTVRVRMTDGLGDTWDVTLASGEMPEKIDGRWNIIIGEFRVPPNAAPGPSDFFIDRAYPCPDESGETYWINDDRQEDHLPFMTLENEE